MEDVITMYKRRATEAMSSFLHSLTFVPSDKLTWSPTPTAKSALQIAAHCAGYSGGFASIIRAGKFASSVEEFRGPIYARIESVTTLEQAETMLRQGMADTLAALDTVKPEQIESKIDTPHGAWPFRFFLNVPARHLNDHEAQIEYLQTCWGDLEVHLQ